VLRVDDLPQALECEANDALDQASKISPRMAIAGTLRARDVDHYRVSAKAGEPLVVDVEARRLGTPLSPVITVLTPSGAALVQRQTTRGCAGDARVIFTPRVDGDCIIQVRDLLYEGGEHATYRLRMGAGPFATGMFPLGGPRGETIVVSVSGGNLTKPYARRVALSGQPGSLLEIDAIEGPSGAILAPQRLIVGDGPEVSESAADASGRSTTPLAFGATANGRLDRPGERDRYVVRGAAGARIRVKVTAAPLGSWLDSVVTLRDAQGQVLGENDDPLEGSSAFRGFGSEKETDSLIEHVAASDGDLVVEIADRYGDGGPEYAYRLSVGPPKADVSAALRFPEGGGESSAAAAAVNLRPGTSLPITVLVKTEGRPGPVVLRVVGLPRGVSASPVTLRAGDAVRRSDELGRRSEPPLAGRLILRADPDAEPALGQFRVEASFRTADGTMTRTASATVQLGTNTGAPRPVFRVLEQFPVRILGRP
jgi:hypothetical protein